MSGRHVNGEMILLARRRRKKTQTQLAAITGIPQAAISRIENGAREDLSSEDVKKIATELGFPISFFYQREPFYQRPLSLHSAAFRKRASVPVKEAEWVVACGNHYIIQLRSLLDGVDLESEFDLVQFEVASSKNAAGDHARAIASASEAASAIRGAWQVGSSPLVDLTSFVEASGVFVIHADLGDSQIDGFTLRPIGMRPVIFLNRSRSADRMRFSLAHEFAHAVLHAFPYEGMETEANEFAAELLLPKDSIVAELERDLSIFGLGKLKLKWQVSIASLIYRAKALGVISADEATKMWINFQPYRKREPEEFDFSRESPKLARRLIDTHVNDLGYSIAELSDAARTSVPEFSEMHSLVPQPIMPERPRLRVVSNRG